MARSLLILLALAAGLFALTASPTVAPAAETKAGRVPMPVVPKALGDAEPGHSERMRTRHMKLMVHKRDQTMRQGIRTKTDSLKTCISCHAVPGPGKRAISVEDPKHFCRACHDFAAVTIDCFSCHASRPNKDFADILKELAILKDLKK
ncbi:MAG: hypothetical protein HQ503_08010 [Rhodospirillales bacterium]|nr:hypothetical protein [Rhodospirillales bacterium]